MSNPTLKDNYASIFPPRGSIALGDWNTGKETIGGPIYLPHSLDHTNSYPNGTRGTVTRVPLDRELFDRLRKPLVTNQQVHLIQTTEEGAKSWMRRSSISAPSTTVLLVDLDSVTPPSSTKRNVTYTFKCKARDGAIPYGADTTITITIDWEKVLAQVTTQGMSNYIPNFYDKLPRVDEHVTIFAARTVWRRTHPALTRSSAGVISLDADFELIIDVEDPPFDSPRH